MKLSMSLIANELSGIIRDTHISDDSHSRVSAIKILYESDSPLNQEYVYLCQPVHLQALVEQKANLEGQNLIIYGNDSSDLKEALRECNYLCISETSSFFYFMIQEFCV